MSEQVELDGVRARRYAKPNPELEQLIPGWLRAGDVEGATELRKGRVWLWRDVTLKLFPARSAIAQPFRVSRAIRCAELQQTILPVHSPAPILATSDFRGSSLLCYEYVDGLQLKNLWSTDAKARESYPEFLALMHKSGVFHGDFHLDQSVWSGEHWYLLDLEGIRHPLRNFLSDRLVIGHWTRISFDLTVHCKATPEELRELFDRYVAAGGLCDDPDSLWKRICEQVEINSVAWKQWPLMAKKQDA